MQEKGGIKNGYETYDILQAKVLWMKLLEELFCEQECKRIFYALVADTEKNSIVSCRAFEKNGFVNTGQTETLLKWQLS